MIAAAWDRVPNSVKVDGFVWPLLILGCAAAFAGGLTSHDRLVTTVKTVHVSPASAVAGMTGPQLVAALGKPDQVQTQDGVTCAVWRSKEGVTVCWR